MARHDYVISDQNGLGFLGDLEDLCEAIRSSNSGAGFPANPFPYLEYVDTSTDLLMRVNAAGAAGIIRGTVKETLVIARASNTQLTVADYGRAFYATGTWTQTIAAISGLPDGWYVDYKNDGSGVITIDPNASEQIDGANTIDLAAGEACRIYSNGAVFKTFGRSIATGSAGGLVFLDDYVISSGDPEWHFYDIDQSYNQYLIIGERMGFQSNNVGHRIQVSASSGSSPTYNTSGQYNTALAGHDRAGSNRTRGINNSTYFELNDGSGIGQGATDLYRFELCMDFTSGVFKTGRVSTEHYSGGHHLGMQGAVILESTSVIQAIKGYGGSGNLSGGNVRLYGIANS